jgi:PTH2 family peptidyl-tRNA hydrolase
MVIAVRTDLKMGTGKIAAQVGHGVLGAYKSAIGKDPASIGIWEESGQPKIVVKVENEFQLREIHKEAVRREIPVCLVTDAGRTQIEPGTVTVCSVGPGPEGVINKITGHLKLL